MKLKQKLATNKPAILAHKYRLTSSNTKQTLALLNLHCFQIHFITSVKQHIYRSFNTCLVYPFNLQKTESLLLNLLQKTLKMVSHLQCTTRRVNSKRDLFKATTSMNIVRDHHNRMIHRFI